MTTLAVMAAGILAGRVFPAGQKSNNERLQLLCTLLLIFSMGVSLGQREDFFSELALLGAQALLFFLLPTVCSILLVYALTRRFLPESSPRTAGPETGGAPAAAGRAPDPMLFLALGRWFWAFCAGRCLRRHAFWRRWPATATGCCSC